jgi:hypothetical protein
MIASPKWREVVENLVQGQTPTNWSNFITNVYEQKKNALVKDTKVHGCFSKQVFHVCAIEILECNFGSLAIVETP